MRGDGVVQYGLLSSKVDDLLVKEAAQDYRADAISMVRSFRAADGNEVPMDEVAEVVRSIGARPGIEAVTLSDHRGVIVVAGDERDVGGTEPKSPVRARVLRGHSHSGPEAGPEEHKNHFEHLVPVELPTGRYVLHVHENRSSLTGHVTQLTQDTTLLVLLGLIVGLPAFYLFGGRYLSRLHRAASSARRDALTGLENHRAFKDEIARAMAHAARYDRELSLAIVDIDDFKFENDRHGHRHGDHLLCALAALLSRGRAADRPFRLGGDEFAVLLPDTGPDDAAAAMRRVITAAHTELAVTVSVGLATLATGTVEPEILWEQADSALYEAKRQGGNVAAAFDSLRDGGSLRTPGSVRALRRLLEEKRMGVAFQPIWDFGRGVIGYEALARPPADYGFSAGPVQAFDIAERTGRAAALDDVCRQAILSRAHELPPEALLFLNVAPQSLELGALAGDSLVRAAEAAGLTPDRVVLEISERLTTLPAVVVAEAARLGNLGFRVALDDVGARNAGLEMLRRLRVDFVKIDKQVVVSAVTQQGTRAVLAAIIAFAAETGAFVIAEGIETEEMLEFVRGSGFSDNAQSACIHGGQGYLLGRPSEASIGEPLATAGATVSGTPGYVVSQ